MSLFDNVMLDNERPPKYGDTYLDESRPLTGVPADYVNAGDEPRYECATINPKAKHFIDPFWPGRDNLDQFRKDCEVIDNERE